MKSFTVEQIAEMEAVHAETVLQWIRAGELPAHNASASRISKKPRWRVTDADLAAFRLSRQSGASVPATPRRKRKSETITQYV